MLSEEAGIEAGILKGQETNAFLEMRGLPGGRHHARSLHREASSASSLRLQHPSFPRKRGRGLLPCMPWSLLSTLAAPTPWSAGGAQAWPHRSVTFIPLGPGSWVKAGGHSFGQCCWRSRLVFLIKGKSLRGTQWMCPTPHLSWCPGSAAWPEGHIKPVLPGFQVWMGQG